MSIDHGTSKVDLSKDRFLNSIQELRSVTASLSFHHKMVQENMAALGQLMESLKQEIQKFAMR